MTKQTPQYISLIISAYNNHEVLEKVMWCLERQTRLPDEIIIADDGSGQAFQDFLTAYTAKSTLPVTHIWQDDVGFRKARVMNKAIHHATGDYLIMIDADVLIPKEFIATHCALAKPGVFLSGGSQIQVPQWLQHLVTRDDIEQETLFTRNWYSQHKVPHARLWRLRIPQGWPSRLVDAFTPRPNSLIGCNASCWKADALAIGGFNEAFTSYGYEDRDFAQRLARHGIRGIRYQCSLRYVHWEHDHPYANDDEIAQNKTRVSKL